MSEQVLLQQTHPDGTFQAVVEDDGLTVFLYLHGPGGLRPCWVRNREPAPERFDPRPSRGGGAPMQPASHVRPGAPTAPLDPASLSLVWLQEGNGAALLEHDDILAVLPGWAGTTDCPGYARDALGQGPVAWSLADAPVLADRVRADQAWWRAWTEGDPFTPVRDAQHAAIEAQIGPIRRYFAIDGGRWPPRALVLADRPPGRILATLGTGIRRQPLAEQHLPDDAAGTRIELALALHPSVSDPDPWMRVLAAVAAVPWSRVTWLGAGHTIAHPGLPDPWSALFLHPTPPPGLTLTLPEIDGEPVLVLWGTPITAAERTLAQHYGRDKLVERLGEALSQVMVRGAVG